MWASVKGVFIGYRRDDTQGSAGRLYDRLAEHYGPGRVFRDVDSLQPGADFAEKVQEAIDNSGATLIVIGRDWESMTDESGRRRLENTNDYVRIEVETALAQDDHLLIPVLVDGATVPRTERLPTSIQPLCSLNAFEIRDGRFDNDVEALIGTLGLRPQLSVMVKQNRPAVLGLAVVFAVAVALGARLLIDRGLDRLSGDFNLAVAELDVGQGDQATARSLSEATFDRLTAQLNSSERQGDFVNIEVASPAEIGAVQGDTFEDRATRASQLSIGLDADVVFYGQLDVAQGITRYVAEFYLSDRNLRNAEELSGAYQLAALELATTDPVAVTREVTALLEAQTFALSELILGLSFYSLGDYESALARFIEAEKAWQGVAGKEVVFHMLGNASGKIGPKRLAEAHDYYESALELDPDYARSLFGIAEVRFQESKGPECGEGSPSVDLAGLEEASERFEAVRSMEAPPLSFLGVRSTHELGRIYLCSSLYDDDRTSDARAAFENVVTAAEGTPRLRTLEMDARQSLAAVHLLTGHPLEAIEEYRAAIDLSIDAAERASYLVRIGFVYECHLDDPTAALQEYEQSVDVSRAVGHEPPARIPCPDT